MCYRVKGEKQWKVPTLLYDQLTSPTEIPTAYTNNPTISITLTSAQQNSSTSDISCPANVNVNVYLFIFIHSIIANKQDNFLKWAAEHRRKCVALP